ncbi:MAG: CUB domain-containing protein [Bacteroidota bacterium]
MRKITALLFFAMIFSALSSSPTDPAVTNPYQQHFDKAYQLYPHIKRGVLEAVAFANTRFYHLSGNEEESCIGMPKAYSVMGLILDGKNYFAENLKYVSTLSGYSVEEIIASPEKSILAYAKAYDILLQAAKDSETPNGNIHETVWALVALSELPHQDKAQYFALYTQLYGILSFMTAAENQARYNFPDPGFDLKAYFGTNYDILSSPSVKISSTDIEDKNGNTFKVGDGLPVTQSPDYGPALWNPAASCNYSVGRSAAVSAVTIHTVQGSYAGCISWFQNCQAGVSAHYVVRSSDGQITQMVLESNTGWHVGNQNSYTVGIEHEGYVSQTGWYTTAMYQASAALTADICWSHGIDPLRTGFWPWMNTTYYNQSSIPGSCAKVKGHMHYPSQTHTDPGVNWDWDYFYKLINTQPTPTTYTAATGTIYDSGGPTGNYVDDERSVWVIAPANATQVSLTFSSFNLENTWDYLYIYDGTDVWAPLIGYYTGTGSPGTVTANSGAITLEFRSDCSSTDAGWNANWTSNSSVVVPANLSVTAGTCPVIGVTLNWTNSGNGWFVDVSDDPNFSYFWNKDVSNLTSTVCPGSFCDYPNCNTYLKFEPGTTYYWRIWNGSTQTYGGSFTTPVCAYTDNNCSGTIDDSGGPSGAYAGNEDWTYTIAPTNAASVTISFSAFDLELNYDSLYIYDGASTNAPLIGGYTGMNSPGSITSGTGAITLHFISDPFVENAGFSAAWSCTPLTTAVSELDNVSGIHAYPNPFSGSTTISYSLGSDSKVEIKLIDVLGREILLFAEANQQSGEHSLEIDFNELVLAKGIYTLWLSCNGKSSYVKLFAN